MFRTLNAYSGAVSFAVSDLSLFSLYEAIE
jgi:hypothetical protein